MRLTRRSRARSAGGRRKTATPPVADGGTVRSPHDSAQPTIQPCRDSAHPTIKEDHVTLGPSRADDLPPTFDDRTALTTLLDYVRDTVQVKCAGLSDDDARRAPLATSPLMTIAGLVNHLRWLEHWWFEVILLGAEDQAPWTDDDPDGEMRVAVEIPIERLLADYRSAGDRNREAMAVLDLDTLSQGDLGWRKEPVTLRWIMLHMVEETARHNGHLDILRELADGVTGR
jgi:uncharacterized damage-inducible protein DinB